ncbi:MAG TPA: fibrinogen-like YCDxxxxGGGW domain-containing protein [Polyangiaceae bacterium LLY-WYZ-15_(1-7)]|nr:fibrinogen-like YCDxxxxGGGW domain-containing protein [Polyangiaceae bacterium LLY-WYZ-15_(1-7)]
MLRFGVACACVAGLMACGDDDRRPIGGEDAGGGVDSGPRPGVDAGPGTDATTPPPRDAGPGEDAMTPPPVDAGPMPEFCDDGVRNGDEVGVDCGGSCPGCPDDGPCRLNGDCLSGVCIGGICQAASCEDGLQNGDETGRDCGGSCEVGCPLGSGCVDDDDCAGGVCADDFCQAANCFNMRQDAGETDVDCGGTTCGPCPAGSACLSDADCIDGSCTDGFCLTPECMNGALDPGEADVDCGGECVGCDDGTSCTVDSDCFSDRCDDTGVCSSCSDGERNGDEADVDCGGDCRGCPSGTACTDDSDCASRSCEGGTCAPGATSCLALLQAEPTLPSGVYEIQPDPAGPVREVWCDMDTDGGGWTLVAASSGTTLNDQASDWYADLATLSPAMANAGVWGGMNALGLGISDIRFACKRDPVSGPMDVDLSFYANDWYEAITESTTDAGTCFAPGSGSTTTPFPERQNNLTSERLVEGDTWDDTAGFEGEDSCGDTGDFTVDFDAGGMDRTDPTDWGEDDSGALCGTGSASSGVWFVFFREALCANGELDPGEADVDCGGACAGCVDGTFCADDGDCASDRCDDGVCTSCEDGALNGDEVGIDCGGSCVGCPEGTACTAGADCASRECDGGFCTNVPASCRELLAADASAASGLYLIQPDPAAAPIEVWCDMETDGGGWTLVASTNGTTLNDQASVYYADLATLSPAEGHEGIWDGMRDVAGAVHDVRFSCKTAPAARDMTVDLSFYRVDWYRAITGSTSDADNCFHPGSGTSDANPNDPERRNNVTGERLAADGGWDDSAGLEGEDSCSDSGDFTLDFDAGGMDRTDSETDWGEDDSSALCGSSASDGAWFVWVRERVPDLSVRVLPSTTECGAATVEVTNLGGGRFATFDLTISVDGSSSTEVVSSGIDSGETLTRAVTGATGTITATVSAVGDEVPTNDEASAMVTVIPLGAGYAEDFEAGPADWSAAPADGSWEHGAPAGVFIPGAATGTRAWVTRLDGDYQSGEVSYLYSPCFDFGGAASDPVLSFQHIYRTEACCDQGWVEISTDGGATWSKLGASGSGTNWYNDAANDWWDGSSGGSGLWREASHPLTGSAGASAVRLRFVLESDGSITDEGFGVDGVTIAP